MSDSFILEKPLKSIGDEKHFEGVTAYIGMISKQHTLPWPVAAVMDVTSRRHSIKVVCNIFPTYD